jgi:peptidoglycan hydrolase-like protein with peptidoglycan-binding domain
MMLSAWYKRRIIAPSTEADHEAVTYVQRVLGAAETGDYDEETHQRIRGFQALFNIRRTGIIDDRTAEQIEHVFPYGA